MYAPPSARNLSQPFTTVCAFAVRPSHARMLPERCRKYVRLTCGGAIRAAAILAFANEVCVSVLCGAAIIMAFAEEVCLSVTCAADDV